MPEAMSDQRAINVSARLKRDVAIHRAAQVLADATACRAQQEPRGLTSMPAEERDWFKATARQLVDIYLQITGVQPIAPIGEPPVIPLSNEASRMILRQQARDAATARGHLMDVFQPIEAGRDGSMCRRCGRLVFIDSAIYGAAIDEGCLTEAGKDGQ